MKKYECQLKSYETEYDDLCPYLEVHKTKTTYIYAENEEQAKKFCEQKYGRKATVIGEAIKDK